MKTKITLLALSLVCLLAPSCTTTQPTPTSQTIARLAGIAFRTGVAFDLHNHPDHRSAYEVCLLTLDRLVDDQNFDPVALQSALSELPIREFKNETGALITEGIVLFVDLVGSAYQPDSAPVVHDFLVNLRNGLMIALKVPELAKQAPPPRYTPRATVRQTIKL